MVSKMHLMVEHSDEFTDKSLILSALWNAFLLTMALILVIFGMFEGDFSSFETIQESYPLVDYVFSNTFVRLCVMDMPLMGLMFSAMAIILLEADRYMKDYSTYMQQTIMYKITYATASLTRFLAMSPFDFTFFLFAYTIS